jgi:hypothetical protein
MYRENGNEILNVNALLLDCLSLNNIEGNLAAQTCFLTGIFLSKALGLTEEELIMIVKENMEKK